MRRPASLNGPGTVVLDNRTWVLSPSQCMSNLRMMFDVITLSPGRLALNEPSPRHQVTGARHVESARPSARLLRVRRDEGAGGKRRRIGEVELVAVRVRDDHEPVAPLPVLYIHAAPFQFRPQGIQHADIERDEHQALANFIGPLRRENELAALPVDLRDPRFPLLLISPGCVNPSCFT